MDQPTQIRLIERVHDLLAANSTDMAAEDWRNPVAAYTDPARLQREIDLLFRRQPIIVGRSETLARPGDFLTHDRTGASILSVRRRDGGLNAFLNVCRHRGTRLVDAPCGQGKRSFVCPYHAWTYDLDGKLVGIPDAEGFPGVDKAQQGLVALPVAERAGFVFVVPTPGAALDIDAYLGQLGADFDGWGLQDHVTYRPTRFRKKINWKLTFDLFLETYHIRYAHAGSIYPIFFDNVGIFERFAPHLRNLFPKRSIAGLRGAEPQDWKLREHANVLYALFPNTTMLVEPDHVAVFHVYPDGIGDMVMDGYTLLPEAPRTEKAIAYWDKNIAILYGAIEEDFALGETIQQGFASGANSHLAFGRFEQSLRWYHEAVNAALHSAA